VHPPKVETFDVQAGTNTDPKGFVRSVDEYRQEPFGLYMSRAMVGHPRCSWVESWLLPELGIRVTEWWFNPGQERDQDFYIDIVDIEQNSSQWRTTDHYLDLVTRTGRDTEVLDVDEFLAAVEQRLVDLPTAQRAMEITHRALTGIAGHGHDLDEWLATAGITLTWRGR
jgi:predicted RNA-binding protein associated with RNAse of E/G family